MHIEQLPAKTGRTWVLDGFRLLRRAPLPLLALTFIYLLVLMVATLIPLIGPFAPMMLTPALIIERVVGNPAVMKLGPVLIAFGDLQTYLVAGRTVVASKVLAGAKEGVYQEFMSQMGPNGVFKSLPAATDRLWQSWHKLALPQLLSLADFRNLPDRKAIRLL